MTTRWERRPGSATVRVVCCAALASVGAVGWLLAAGSPTGGGHNGDAQRGRAADVLARTGGQIAIREAVEDGGFDELRAAYVGTLRSIADDGSQAAVAIAELQRAAYRTGSLNGLQRLRRFQLSFASTLAARDRRCLPPIIWAHYESAGLQTRVEDRPVRAPALEVAADLATVMCRSATDDAELRFASDAMVCSAFTLLTDGSRIQADRLFGRLIRLSPGTRLGWLGAAAIDERYGRYDEVVRLLDDGDPQVVGAEGRLRLAVNLARIGDGDRSREVLGELLAADPPDWIRVVAVEELARRFVEQHDLAAAEEVLRAALAELPSVSGLHVQLAWVLDQEGHPAAAGRELEALTGAAADQAVPARWRYADWPRFDRAAVEADLARIAAGDATALAAVLARGEGGAAS